MPHPAAAAALLCCRDKSAGAGWNLDLKKKKRKEKKCRISKKQYNVTPVNCWKSRIYKKKYFFSVGKGFWCLFMLLSSKCLCMFPSQMTHRRRASTPAGPRGRPAAALPVTKAAGWGRGCWRPSWTSACRVHTRRTSNPAWHQAAAWMVTSW